MILLKEIMDPLKLDKSKELVTIVGAGGKTGTMFTLAKELKSLGKRVLVTTTTAIYKPSTKEYDRLYMGDIQGFIKKLEKHDPSQNSGEIVVWGKETDKQEKIQGINPEDINKIWEDETFSWILVEGDGAKRKNIKAPRDNEPVIPSKTTIVIGVVGMQVLGKPINESSVHRVEHFMKITGTQMGDPIDEEVLHRLILHKQGLFKGKPTDAKRVLLLNQCEDETIRNRALAFADRLSISYLITSLQKQKVYGAKII